MTLAEQETRGYKPRAPNGLSPAIKNQWSEFWDSPLAEIVDPVDYGAIRRLFTYRNELEALMVDWDRMADDERYTEATHTGTLQIHPMEKRMVTLERQVQSLEDRFGITPGARAKLEVDISQSRLTWTQIQNQQLKNVEIASGAGKMAALPVRVVEE